MAERVLHLIWLGSQPAWVKESVERWREALPDWYVNVWDDSAPGLNQIVQRAPHLSVRAHADFLRLQLVQRFGGVYVDLDTIPLRPELLEREGDWIGSKPVPESVTLINAHFGFERGSDFLAQIENEAWRRVRAGRVNDHWVAGPRTWRAVYDAQDDPPPLVPLFPTISKGSLTRRIVDGSGLDLDDLRSDHPDMALLHVIYSRRHAR